MRKVSVGMLKRMVIMLVAVGVVFGGIFTFQAFKAQKIRQFLELQKAPPQTVAVVSAQSQEWQQRLEAVGSVRAVNGANLSAEVSGIVLAIHFKSGADVQQGELLVELTSAADAARLETLKAAAALAKITYDRDASLLKKNSSAVSQATIDTDEANLKGANAQVAQQQATLNYKFIRAPFPGRLGIVQVDPGQYIAAGAPVVSLQQIDPVYVDFYLPQQALAKIKQGLAVTAHTDTYPGRNFTGKIAALDSYVDTATRNIKVRASFANPDKLLLPGMFATVDIDVGDPQQFVTLPKTAISYNSYGDIVFLVEEKKNDSEPGKIDHFAKQAFVTTGLTRGGQVAILSGVKNGDVVVTSGQVKLRNGVPLNIDNSVQPSANPNPTVADE
jgi:membrane fusion protein, multidrug efflux system